MALPPAELAGLRSFLGASEALLAAEVTRAGVVVAANRALAARAGGELAGVSLGELLTPPQRPALEAAIAAAGEGWSAVTVTLDGRGGRPPEDQVLRLTAIGDDAVLAVCEPARAERDLLVEQVLGLNDELITVQRSLGRRQRELEQARAEAEAAERRTAQLEAIVMSGLKDGAGDALTALLDVAQTIVGADGAAVLLLDESRPRLAARAALGLDDDEPGPPHRVVALGEGVAGTVAVSRRPLAADADSADAQGGAVAAVPLVLDGAVAGVLEVRSRRAGAFGDPELRLLELVAERASLVIGHAQLRERERRISETLQRSLLPERLPALPGVELAARYRPRMDSVQVGGDFYDAVARPDGTLSVAIGDVAGKGLRAAAVMGQLRSGLHAYALDGRGAHEVLERLDRLVVEAGNFATAMHVVLDVATGAAALAGAGHPPALVRAAAGPADWVLGGVSPPLGAGSTAHDCVSLTLGTGDVLLLYTDGLYERRGEHPDARLEELRATLEEGPDDLEALCDHLVERLGSAGYEDDVALLVVRRR